MPLPTTFVSLAEPTYGVIRKAAFLVALDAWAKREKDQFSLLAPPVDALAGGETDENATLAAVFFRLTRQENLTAQIALLQLELFHHNRLLGIAWDHARREPNARHRPQRATYFDLRPYEEMISVLENWAEALHQRATEDRP